MDAERKKIPMKTQSHNNHHTGAQIDGPPIVTSTVHAFFDAMRDDELEAIFTVNHDTGITLVLYGLRRNNHYDALGFKLTQSFDQTKDPVVGHIVYSDKCPFVSMVNVQCPCPNNEHLDVVPDAEEILTAFIADFTDRGMLVCPSCSCGYCAPDFLGDSSEEQVLQ